MKTGKTIAISIGAIALAILIGISVIQHRELQKLRVAQPAAEASAGPAEDAACAGMTSSEASPADSAPQDTGGEIAAAHPPPPAAAVPSPTAGPAGGAPMAGISKMMQNPAMKEMIRTQQKAQMDLMYGPLLKYLQLSDADLETFRGILLDKQMAMMDSALDMMNGKATPEKRKALSEKIKAITADYDAQIRTFLGEEDYAVYQMFEATQPERQQVSMFKGSLSGSDPLTEEQEDRLIREMHDARTGFQFSSDVFKSGQVSDPSQLTPEQITALIGEQARFQEQFVPKAAAILTAGQLEQFKAFQKQYLEMMELGMSMAAQMMGAPAQSVPEANP